jgi:small subunit ribosomal protein S27Ae
MDLSMTTLSHNGLVMSDMSSLEQESTVFVSAPLLGGKRKKKVFTTKKKNKHIHKKEKLATLKLYSVKGGDVIRNRKVCPMSPECGPGVFMSKHYDRYYCGRCQLTLKLDPETIKANKAAMEAKKLASENEATKGAVKDEAKGKKGKKK